MIVYPILGLDSPWHAPILYIQALQAIAQLNLAGAPGQGWDPRYLRFMAEGAGWPVTAAALVGLVSSIRGRRSGTMLFLVWFAVFYGVQDLVIHFKEARYVFPAFPPLYFFAARGMEAGVGRIRSLAGVGRRSLLAQAALVAAVVAVPFDQAVAECIRWSDGFYSTPFASNVSAYAHQLAAGHAQHWVGWSYPLHPTDYIFDRDEPYAYLYAFYGFGLSYWNGDPFDWLQVSSISRDPNNELGLRPEPNIGVQTQDGDVLVIYPYTGPLVTATVPVQLDPMVVERVRLVDFAPSAGGAFASPGGGTIALQATSGGYRMVGTGIADRTYEIYSVSGDGIPTEVGTVAASQGALSLDLAVSPSAVASVRLLYYDSVRSFVPPR